MKILISGAGIAGLTLAALLRQRGLDPVIVEKKQELTDKGYMIGLYPTGANVLHGLHAYEEYLANSVTCKYYEAYTEGALLLKKFPFTEINEKYGFYQLIGRNDLLKILLKAAQQPDIRFATAIESVTQTFKEIIVRFTDGKEESFDVLVGADGIHSHVRSLTFAKSDYRYFDTRWGCWVWWVPSGLIPPCTIQEYWGTGTFWGMYPMKDKVGVLASVHYARAEQALQKMGRRQFFNERFQSLKAVKPEFFVHMPQDTDSMFYWHLSDQRAKIWRNGRIVLLGDAGTAFLPTAGVGASIAMESAAVLNDILSRTDKYYVMHALELFEKRRRKRVEKIQQNSRKLARMMFVDSAFGSWCRDSMTRLMPVESLIKNIIRGFDEPI